MATKSFHLRVLLTVTTGRLLTKSKGERDNGISDLYDLLGHMTNDQPFTHQLGRFAEECKPWLLRWFPALAACGADSALAKLDDWIACDRTKAKDEGVKMWLAELKMLLPMLQDEYDVPQIPADDHARRHPVAELIQLRSKGGVA